MDEQVRTPTPHPLLALALACALAACGDEGSSTAQADATDTSDGGDELQMLDCPAPVTAECVLDEMGITYAPDLPSGLYQLTAATLDDQAGCPGPGEPLADAPPYFRLYKALSSFEPLEVAIQLAECTGDTLETCSANHAVMWRMSEHRPGEGWSGIVGGGAGGEAPQCSVSRITVRGVPDGDGVRLERRMLSGTIEAEQCDSSLLEGLDLGALDCTQLEVWSALPVP